MAHAHGPCTIAGACQHAHCAKYAIGEDAFCWVCQRALCREHYDSELHSCRYTYVDEIPVVGDIVALRKDLDPDAILNRVRELRPGLSCSVHVPHDLSSLPWQLSGGHNIHLIVEFEDAVEWLVRLSGYPSGPVPSATAARTLQSEAVTYERLGRIDGFPIAKLHDWGTARFSKSNNAACVYLIYDRVRGEPCTEPDTLLGIGVDNDEILRMFVQQYVAASVKLADLTFDAIGSLDRDHAGNIIVGSAVESPWYDEKAGAVFGGPFRCLRDKYLFDLDNRLKAIRNGRMHRAGPLLPYLIFLNLHRQVSSSSVLAQEDTEFFLAHADLNAHNILATSDKITAIVDWEWARTTTKADAFASPFWTAGITVDDPLDRAEGMIVDAYRQAGRLDLADCVMTGGLYSDLDLMLMSPTPCDSPEGFILRALNRLAIRLEDNDWENPPSTLREWGQRALAMYASDPYLAGVIELDGVLQAIRKPDRSAQPKDYERRPKQWRYSDFVPSSSS